MTEPFYITTPIYYVNDVPHLGHAYTTIAADAIARFHRARGADARLLTGTDEHGQKIETAANERGITPRALADEVVSRFRDTWKNLDINLDDFIRTTEPRHQRVVAEMWRRMHEAGDLYLDAYRGFYCVACEAFYTDGQLLPGKLCPVHKREASWVEEPSYFFRLSKYQQPLLDHLARHPELVRPEGYRNEIRSFVESGLRDLSVSRTTFNWGIPVPGDPAHVIYVWIDALTNYISALGDIGGPLYERYWPAQVHLIGKDILRFHAVYWPCMLMSAGLPLPESIFVHGWWTVRGEKISKSMPATRVDPNQLAHDLGADALRYFLLREVPLGLDGDFSYEALIGRYNADLANDLGNLVGRALTMTGKFAGGTIPAAAADSPPADSPAGELLKVTATSVEEAAACFSALSPSRALEAIWRLVRETNRFIDTAKPWMLAKNPATAGEVPAVMRTCLQAIYVIARMIAPVLPKKAAEILAQLGIPEADRPVVLGRWPDKDSPGHDLPAGLTIHVGQALFPRIDADRQRTLLDVWLPQTVAPGKTPAAKTGPEKSAPAKAPAANGARVSFDEVQKIELRVAVVLSAEAIPKTKKLLKLTVDAGETEPRQVVAGIAEAFSAADIVGHKVILVANLQPAEIRGVKSEGMILAAGDRTISGLATVDRDVPAGTPIR